MYWTDHHVLCCTAIHCMKKGGSTVAGRLRIELKRRGLDHRVMCNTCDSIELCDMGPNLVVYPEGIIYAGVQVKDIKDIVAHLEGGPPVERLIITPDRPDELNRRHFYEAAVDAGDSMPLDAFHTLAEQYDLDADWVLEQKYRGFIAVKDVEDQGEQVTVTSKAKLRYFIPVASE